MLELVLRWCCAPEMAFRGTVYCLGHSMQFPCKVFIITVGEVD